MCILTNITKDAPRTGAGWHGSGRARKGPEHGEAGGSKNKGWVGGRTGTMNSGNNGGPTKYFNNQYINSYHTRFSQKV